MRRLHSQPRDTNLPVTTCKVINGIAEERSETLANEKRDDFLCENKNDVQIAFPSRRQEKIILPF